MLYRAASKITLGSIYDQSLLVWRGCLRWRQLCQFKRQLVLFFLFLWTEYQHSRFVHFSLWPRCYHTWDKISDIVDPSPRLGHHCPDKAHPSRDMCSHTDPPSMLSSEHQDMGSGSISDMLMRWTGTWSVRILHKPGIWLRKGPSARLRHVSL